MFKKIIYMHAHGSSFRKIGSKDIFQTFSPLQDQAIEEEM